MKKFLSFALALLMVVGLVPAFVQQADAINYAWNFHTHDKTANKFTPTLDGVLEDGWGTRKFVYTAFPANTYACDYKTMEAYTVWDSNYLYYAVRLEVADFEYGTKGNAETGTRIKPLVDITRNNGVWEPADNVFGNISIASDGTVTYNNAKMKVAAKVQNGYATYEIAIPASVVGASTLKPGAPVRLGLYLSDSKKKDAGFTTIGEVLLEGTKADWKTVLPIDSITLDGKISDLEWGSPTFTLNGEPSRAYYCQQTAVGHHYEAAMRYYYRYDSTNLYVGVVLGEAPAGSGSGNGSTYVTEKGSVLTTKTTMTVVMGKKLITVTHPTIGTFNVSGIPAANFAASIVGNDVFYEFKIPLSDVGTGTMFKGYVEFDIQNQPRTVNGVFTSTSGRTRIRSTPAFTYQGSASDGFAGALYDTFLMTTEDDGEVSTGPSATPNPNPTGSAGLNPGLNPGTPSATPVPNPAPSAANFTDVKKSDWFYEDLAYVVEAGLMNGVGNNKFAPGNDLDRAMLVTTLWRLAGEPTVNVNTFDDVPRNAWYTDAVNWAAEDGIVKGYAGCFNPTDGITREQVVAILHRYADMMGYRSSDFSNRYYKTSDWAAEDVAWADANGLLDIATDMEDMTETANRAEIAALLATFCRTFVD